MRGDLKHNSHLYHYFPDALIFLKNVENSLAQMYTKYRQSPARIWATYKPLNSYVYFYQKRDRLIALWTNLNVRIGQSTPDRRDLKFFKFYRFFKCLNVLNFISIIVTWINQTPITIFFRIKWFTIPFKVN